METDSHPMAALTDVAEALWGACHEVREANPYDGRTREGKAWFKAAYDTYLASLANLNIDFTGARVRP